MANDITKPAAGQPVVAHPTSILLDKEGFEFHQRAAKMLASSAIFPQALRNGGQEVAVANAFLVLNMAQRMQEDPLAVAQNIYFVGGTPGWKTAYLIAKANQSGKFVDPIDWEIEGEGDDLKVTAFAVLAATKTRKEATVTMAMAKADGWTKNPKYKSMPQTMLQYRSAALLIRLFIPEVTLGMRSEIEIEDERFEAARDVTPTPEPEPEPQPEPAPKLKAKAAPAAEDAEIVDQPKAKQEAEPKPKPKPEPKAEAEAEAEAEPEPEPEAKAEPEPDLNDYERQLLDSINGAEDSEGLDETLEFLSDDLDQVQLERPKAYEALNEAIGQKRASFE